MRSKVLLVLALLPMALVSSGCMSVAASVAGGALVGAGVYALDNTAEDVVALSLEETERVTRTVLGELDVAIIEVTREDNEGTPSECTFEACILSDDEIPVDVVLERISDRMTQVSVTAKKSFAEPELETADEILLQILTAAHRRQAMLDLSSPDNPALGLQPAAGVRPPQ